MNIIAGISNAVFNDIILGASHLHDNSYNIPKEMNRYALKFTATQNTGHRGERRKDRKTNRKRKED